MVDRARSPEYLPIQGHVHKDIATQFRVWCKANRVTISEVMETALEHYLNHQQSTTNSASKEESNQLALLILSQLAKGERPSNPDLVIVAEAAGVHTAELIALCDRLFGKGKNSNGVR